MARVDLLLPTRNDTQGAVRAARECLAITGSHDIRILVSISDPRHHDALSAALRTLGSDRIIILPPGGDLSLYGNFRRLVRTSDADWVTICADDDAKAPDFVEATLSCATERTVGITPAISLREFDRPTASFGRDLRFIPASPPGRTTLARVSHIEASWIFGMWRRSWLDDAFSDQDWDWLDSAIVQKAIAEDEFVWCASADPVVCGWNVARAPWAVDGDSHSTAGWESYWQARILPGSGIPRWQWALLVRSRFRRTARLLNRQAEAARASAGA